MGFLDEHCLFHELTDEKITASKPFYCGNIDFDLMDLSTSDANNNR